MKTILYQRFLWNYLFRIVGVCLKTINRHSSVDMIRRSIITLDFVNTGKKQAIITFLTEANRVINVFIQRLWSEQKFTGRFVNLKTETWISAKAQQVCCKQALEIVKSQRHRKLKTMPVYKKKCLNLDTRFVEFLDTENSFDFWIKLFGFVPEKITRFIPAKRHRHFNQFVRDGWKLKGSTRLMTKGDQIVLEVFFEKERPKIKGKGRDIGIDIGYRKLLVTSDNQSVGEDFRKIAERIQRKKQGSKAFGKALIERNEYVNRSVKQLPWPELKTLVVEDLKGLKNGKRFRKEFQGRFQRWTYPVLLRRIELTGEISGVHVHRVNPAFTSQTCSKCGAQDKKNRDGEKFICIACGHSAHADVNASINILMKSRLPEHMDPVQKAA